MLGVTWLKTARLACTFPAHQAFAVGKRCSGAAVFKASPGISPRPRRPASEPFEDLATFEIDIVDSYRHLDCLSIDFSASS